MALAATVSRLREDGRTFYHGAVGIRKDGVIVCAANLPATSKTPEAHAEARVLKKLGNGGIVFVVRTLANGLWAESTPCNTCHQAMKNKRVSYVYYTTRFGHIAQDCLSR